MAEAFIGMTVHVKLKPGSLRPSVTGRVVNIHDQTLILEQVLLPDTGEMIPSFNCPSYQISDLEVVDSSIYQPVFPSGASTIPLRVAPSYADPAILSYSRVPADPSYSSDPAANTPTVPTPVKELPADISDLVSPRKVESSQRTTKKGKGWRSTPLLEETTQPIEETPPPQPKKVAQPSRQKKKGRKAQEVQQNGWATEDATDMQDLGDFDFEANLSKFDKKAVFDQIRNDDTTADEDRLVSHNKARPGTYGGKNLHPTEMVLSPKLVDGLDTPSSDTDTYHTSGRNSRQSIRKRELSKQPSQHGGGSHDEPGRSLSRALRNVPSNSRPLNASVISSTSFNRSTSSVRAQQQTRFSSSGPHLRVTNSSQTCPVLNPSRLRQIEQEYTRRGTPAETLVELSAREIAQSLCASLSDVPGPSRRNSKSSAVPNHGSHRDPKPVIVILAGNHAKGARAIAAARYLFGRGFKLLLSLTDYSNQAAWHPVYRTQVQLIQAVGRRMNARMDSWPGISAHIKKLSSPPALIVDALLDGVKYAAIEDVQMSFETREVIDWMNRSRGSVVSLECPSGYDANTGETTVLEGEPLAVKPDRVLGLGAVVQGVFEAMTEGEHWDVSVLDVGLTSSMRSEESVRFGRRWSVDVEFKAGD